jgi:methylenetetrahydrofolate dehydrogenase (NADP+) / methenyltetrahydrofolate cyclohydrolase
MAPLLLDGRVLAQELKAELLAAGADVAATLGAPPRLAVVQVAGDAASDWYVRETTQEELEAAIRAASADPTVSGVIVQLPLPRHLSATAATQALDPRKDVDGLHPVNAGWLAQGLPSLVPNTPAGGLALLDRHGIEVAGKHAVIVGRSNVVGKPLAMLLLARHATVTICHSRTPDLGAMLKDADIVAAAVGQAGLVRGEMLKPGAVVLDFGINVVGEGGEVVGDVDWASASAVAGAITPVPGGTGPVTNMMLLRNTLTAARWAAEKE